jgi:hypothetical protein
MEVLQTSALPLGYGAGLLLALMQGRQMYPMLRQASNNRLRKHLTIP